MVFFRLFGLTLWAAAFLGPIPSAAAGHGNPAQPPALYFRQIEIEVQDLSGRPLSGVKAEVTPGWGSLEDQRDLLSNAEGLIRFHIQPVIEAPMAGLRIRDRFLLYHTAFKYRLMKQEHIAWAGEIDDRQEFAGLADPLYQGADRTPAAKPLTIRVRLPAYRDYLAKPLAGQAWLKNDPSRLKALIDALQDEGRKRGFILTPKSLGLSPQGLFSLGLEFQPLFDPSEMGLLAAGAVLLRDIVPACLAVISEPAGEITSFEFKILARFQYRSKPFALPVGRTFVFCFSSATVPAILAAGAEGRFPLEEIEAKIGDRVIDLRAEINPVEIKAAPGELLSPSQTEPGRE
ncbi:MAG: hypothetical protein SV487_11085 [Thermodesulfobacteriota bacterium]|nr:hypothetical protein [Thermodesulfobacteriota bacterium]